VSQIPEQPLLNTFKWYCRRKSFEIILVWDWSWRPVCTWCRCEKQWYVFSHICGVFFSRLCGYVFF